MTPASAGALLRQGSFVFFLLSRSLSLLGGVATVAIALLWMKLFPSLRDVDGLE